MKSLTDTITYMQQFISTERLEKIQWVAKQRTRHLCVALENVFQPHNISAVIRSADCFGIQDLHVIENGNAFKLHKDISIGSHQWIHLKRYYEQAHNTEAAIALLKHSGYQIAALTLQDNSVELEEVDLTKPTTLLIGAEETGLSPQAHQLADVCVKLPMIGFTQSFNLSVTAALCLDRLSQRLRQGNIPWQLDEPAQQELILEWITRSAQNGQRILNDFQES